MQGQGRSRVTTFYKSQDWRKARLAHLQVHPFCIMCEENGDLVFANTVDHKIPINPLDPFDTQGGKYPHPLDPDNFQSMCASCHNRKSAKEKPRNT